MTVSIHFEGTGAWDSAVEGMVERARGASKEAVSKGAELLANAAKREAPVKQGTLRRGIVRTKLAAFSADAWMSEVGPTVVYGRRVDLGFKGTDSLGRNYDQKGNPYWERGMGTSAPALQSLYEAIFAEALTA